MHALNLLAIYGTCFTAFNDFSVTEMSPHYSNVAATTDQSADFANAIRKINLEVKQARVKRTLGLFQQKNRDGRDRERERER